jgi:hypothetical protein
MDTVGPFPECTATGYRFFSLFVDEVSGYTVLFGNKAKCAFETATALLNLSGWFGIPDSFHSDGGAEFDSDVVHQFSTLCCVRHTLSIARAPNTNGLAERNVQLSKRVLRHLTSSLADFHYWSYLLPLVQRAVNFLHRQDLGCCPQQFVFGLASNQDAFVIPCAPASVSQSLLADANRYHYAAGIMHAALRFQETILMKILELRELQLEAAAASQPASSSTLEVGDLVSIPWRDNSPPTPLHPRMCGPYVVTALDRSANTIQLQHQCSPPPPDQLAQTSWSIRAGVFILSDLQGLPLADPTSCGLAGSTVIPQPIDCILSCSLLAHPLPVADCPAHVRNHSFLVRWLGKPQASASAVSYDVVKHTIACDRFCAANSFLVGHISVLHSPATFDPHVRPCNERPAHPPVPSHELQLSSSLVAPISSPCSESTPMDSLSSSHEPHCPDRF